MSHYEERLQKDLTEIRSRLEDICERVHQSVLDATRAFVEHDRRLATLTILRDRAINRGTRRIDRLCHEFVVRHVPSAGHLRWVSSVLRMNVALERVGDYAAGMCREAVQLAAPPAEPLVRDVQLVAGQAETVLLQSITAFREGNATLARSTIDAVHDVDDAFKHGFHDLIGEAKRRECISRDMFIVHTVLRFLKRVAEQGANICQHTLFLVSGEIKDRKTFRILFADERNDCLSVLAEAYAEKAFPDDGRFASAGWNPAPEVAAPVLEFLDRGGYRSEGRRPRALTTRDEKQRHYHIIVGLGSDPRPHLDAVPYLTAVLDWDVGPPPQLDAPDAEQQLEQSCRRIAHETQALMELLSGPDDD